MFSLTENTNELKMKTHIFPESIMQKILNYFEKCVGKQLHGFMKLVLQHDHRMKRTNRNKHYRKVCLQPGIL